MMNTGPRKLTLPLAAALFLAGLPAAAQAGAFRPPEGCETFLTVQMRSCRVANYWRCGQNDDVWEAAFDGLGPLSVTQYDREFQWLSSFFATDGTTERLANPGPDPISMTGLLETGEDSFEFTIETTSQSGVELLHVKGRDRLTGNTRVIDGVDLLEAATSVTIRRDDGTVTFSTSGVQYVLAEQRLFLLGREMVESDGESQEYDNTPVDLIFPGEPGFATRRPLYECQSIESRAETGAEGGRAS